MKCLSPLDDDFFIESETNYNMRNGTLIQPIYKTTTYGFNSLRYNGAMLYNKLPADFKCVCLRDFKEKVKTWKPNCTCNSCLLCSINNV